MAHTLLCLQCAVMLCRCVYTSTMHSMHIYMNACFLAPMHTHIYTCTHTCTHVHTRTYTHAHTCTHTCMHTHTHAHTHTHTNTQRVYTYVCRYIYTLKVYDHHQTLYGIWNQFTTFFWLLVIMKNRWPDEATEEMMKCWQANHTIPTPLASHHD